MVSCRALIVVRALHGLVEVVLVELLTSVGVRNAPSETHA
jgi:hypothetical protein